MTTQSKILTDKVKQAPAQPGVYIFKNRDEKILYVGKAKNIRNRVKSYFQKGHDQSAKNRLLVKNISDVDFIITDNEVEALILENNLIKKNKPYYNIDLKDDKTFPYIRITKEDYPLIYVTRKIEKDGSKYIGPFTQAQILRQVLRTLQEIFKIRSCRYSLNDKNVRQKKYALCLDYHIHRCDGPCQGLVSKAEYRKIIEQATYFLKGHSDILIREMTLEMKAHADSRNFEQAKEVRDKLVILKKFVGNIQKVETLDWADRDIIALARDEDLATIVVFIVRSGKVINRQIFNYSKLLYDTDEEIFESFLEDYYLGNDDFPGEVIIPSGMGELTGLKNYFLHREQKVDLVIPQKGNKKKLLGMVQRNARLHLDEIKLDRLKKRLDYVPHNVTTLQKDLHMEHPPHRMECFDISNIQGSDPVASMVCFLDGSAKKSEYRIFKIRSRQTPDDFAMIREAVFRRYKRVKDEQTSMPDLIIVDGGKGQLSAAYGALEELELTSIPIISLAKRLEEVFLPGFSEAQNIARTSSSIKLLQQIRDEAHRFAVTHHRKQRKKRTLTSELTTIPGIGEQRRIQLLKYFGSLKKIKEADLEAIKSVPGLPENIAVDIYNHFN